MRAALAAPVLAALLLPGPAPAADAPAATEKAAPRIVVAPEAFDFGRLRPGRQVQKEFLVRNHGRADLRLLSLVASCGCTAVLMETTTVKPGRNTPLRVTLTTPDTPGRLEETVVVESNDPERPRLEVRLAATVVAPSPAPR